MSKPTDIADQFEVKPAHRATVTLLHVYEDEVDAAHLYVYAKQIDGETRLNSIWFRMSDGGSLFRRKERWVSANVRWEDAGIHHTDNSYELNTRTGDVRRVEEIETAGEQS